jgi:virginiamycin B lyase
MFDPETERMKEYKLPMPWGNPYDVVPTKGGAEVWTGSMSNDHVSRLDTKTEEITEYLLPRTTNIRRVFVDEASGKPVLWIGNNHGAAIVKVEPLE